MEGQRTHDTKKKVKEKEKFWRQWTWHFPYISPLEEENQPPDGVPTNPRHQEGQGEEEILEIVDMGFLIFRHWKRNQSDQRLADAMLVTSSKRIVRLFGKYYRIMRMIGPSILLLYVQSTVCLFDPTKGLTMKTQTVQITIIKLLLLLWMEMMIQTMAWAKKKVLFTEVPSLKEDVKFYLWKWHLMFFMCCLTMLANYG